MHNRDLGNWGENQAEEYLRKNEYEIIERNFYSYHGEIDIIAKDKNELIFCEVKTRRNIQYGMPIDAVNKFKQKRIYLTAKYYLYKNNINNISVRFDIIEVYLINHVIRINHIKNAM